MASTTGEFAGVALITGAGGTGIGNAVATGLAASGCQRIAITDINDATLEKTRKDILNVNASAEIFAKSGDIADEAFVDSLIGGVVERFSRIDYGINCAGILGKELGKAADMSAAEFDTMNSINYRGVWLCCRAQLKQMLKQEPLDEQPKQKGSIVNIASQLGIVARPGAAAYCAGKAAVINMTRALAIDYAEDGIRVNCVCPGVIATPMTMSSKEMYESLKPAIDIAPVKRMGTPEEVANAVLFLSSPKASFIVGEALVVDGGYTIN
ncbi:short-chain dehydrogenase/reductase-like protein SDR [Elsinoe ampelina]|uniref:Short-chain dehydrogenase/reductase-like protein SDR n=1 Tax=Elsinoe ampelina TaxID=302913 RepID=A0A6A6G9C1_9PEZI|nr:short-chain dehydrogenase/reductase-like protein SDR [Elsinoe ampelina]